MAATRYIIPEGKHKQRETESKVDSCRKSDEHNENLASKLYLNKQSK